MGDQAGIIIVFGAIHIAAGSRAAALAFALGFNIHRGFQLRFLNFDIAQMESPIFVEGNDLFHGLLLFCIRDGTPSPYFAIVIIHPNILNCNLPFFVSHCII